VSEELPDAPWIEVWQQDDGSWRWRYVGTVEEDGEPLELVSNEPESSEDEAVEAAQLAYPDVPMQVRRETRSLVARRDRHRWAWRAATAGLSLAFTAVALRYRRWWLAPAAPFLARGVVARLRRRSPP
jgi:hypothetical protein